MMAIVENAKFTAQRGVYVPAAMIVALEREIMQLQRERDTACQERDAWRQKYQDFKQGIKRHVDGLLAALVKDADPSSRS